MTHTSIDDERFLKFKSIILTQIVASPQNNYIIDVRGLLLMRDRPTAVSRYRILSTYNKV